MPKSLKDIEDNMFMIMALEGEDKFENFGHK